MADAEAAPIDTADEQASEANVVGEVSADSEEPRTQLFATFESDVARVGKPAPVAHLVDRIQADIAKLRDTYDKSRGELEINVSRLDQRKEAVSKKLDEFSALTKDVIGGSMLCQKSVRDRFATIKESLDEREKEVIAHVKQMEEENMQTLQNTSSELREARDVLASIIDDATKMVEGGDMMEFLNQCGPIEDRMDSLLRHELDIEVSMPVQFDIEFDVDEVCKDLQRRLDPEELLPRPAGSTLEAVKRELNEITKLKDEPEEEKANRRKIESTEDVMLALDSLREEMEDLQNTKARHVKCEEWTEAAHIVSDISGVEREIEKLERDLLSLKKKDAAMSEEREMRTITLQESLTSLLEQKERALIAESVDYREVAELVDQIEVVESEINEYDIELVDSAAVRAEMAVTGKSNELLQYERTVLADKSTQGGIFSFVL